MSTFRYQALNANRDLIAGEIEADGVQHAIAKLEADGLIVQSIGFASAAGEIPTPRAARNLGNLADDPRFDASIEHESLRAHLATVLRHGPALAGALRAYAEEMPAGRDQRQLLTVCNILESKDPAQATTALAALPEYWMALLSSAASAIDPGRVLREFFAEVRRAAELRRQWWMALAYPLVVACVAVFVLVILSFVTISVYRSIFMDFGMELPLLTKGVLAMAMFLTSRWALVALAAVVALIAVLANARRVFSKQFLEWFGYRFGAMFARATGLAQFTRYTAELLRAGVEVPQSLRIAGFATRHPRVRQASWQLADDIEQDRPSRPSQARILTATAFYALRSDLPAASRIELLNEVSRCYSEWAGNRLSWTRGMIEPITICVVGIIVGTTVIALFLPLVRLVNVLSG